VSRTRSGEIEIRPVAGGTLALGPPGPEIEVGALFAL
jgi:hypothetical protein